MRSHISLLPKIPLEGNLNVIKGTNNFLEGHYLVNILVSLKKTMELKKKSGLNWKLQSTYLNMSFNSFTFLGGYLLVWLSFKTALAYAYGPTFT